MGGSRPVRAVIVSGGPTHDFPATSACLAALLAEQGLAPEIHTEVEAGFAALPGAALLVVNALRWTMTAPGTPDRYRNQASTDGVSPSPAARAALTAHLADGGGILAMHTAVICFDDWPQWHQALGARWIWGQSSHPPLGPDVHVQTSQAHPLTQGIPDFTVTDEVYSHLAQTPYLAETPYLAQTPDPAQRPRLTPALSAVPPGPASDSSDPSTDPPAQPLLWSRHHAGGRIVYDALGHHPPSYEVPAHREILSRAIRWTAAPPPT
jgi:uncharacterized protein